MFKTKLGSPAGPFANTAPEYDYWSTTHSLAVERLAFAVGSGILLTVFTGTAGSGKSTVVRKVVTDAQSHNLIGLCSYGPKFNVYPCHTILEAFGADPGFDGEDSNHRILQQSLEAARFDFGLPTLVLDDAHEFNDAQLANLFDLAGFNDGTQGPFFKIILVGMPDLMERLDERFSDLLGPSFELDPMSEKDMAGYIKHRLKVADIAKVPFDDDALGVIYERTGGNPQQINLLCKTMLDDFVAPEMSQMDAKWVRECKIPSMQELEFKLDLSMLRQPVSGTDEKSDTPEPMELPKTKTRKPSASKTENKATKSSAKAKQAKATADPTTISGQVRENAPSFKSKRLPNKNKKTTAETGGSSVSQPVNLQAKPLGQGAGSESPKVTTSEPGPTSTTMDRPKRSSRGRVAVFSGLTGAAALAIFAYYVSGAPNQSEDAVKAAARNDSGATSDVVDPGAVDLGKEANGIAAATNAAATATPSFDDSRATEVANTSVNPAAQTTAPAPPFDTGDTASMLALFDALGAPPDNAAEWYRLGLSIADKNPRATVVAYALAASRDHPRAAYYLGQMYEIGEGVPVDTVLARIWYEKAGKKIEGAAERLTALPKPQSHGKPATPVQLISYLAKNQEAAMVWTSAKGADPTAYTIEFADLNGEVVGRVDDIKSSVLRHTVPETAIYWRIRALAGKTSSSAPSSWLPLDVRADQPADAALVEP